jgi:hypothetical protein
VRWVLSYSLWAIEDRLFVYVWNGLSWTKNAYLYNFCKYAMWKKSPNFCKSYCTSTYTCNSALFRNSIQKSGTVLSDKSVLDYKKLCFNWREMGWYWCLYGGGMENLCGIWECQNHSAHMSTEFLKGPRTRLELTIPFCKLRSKKSILQVVSRINR